MPQPSLIKNKQYPLFPDSIAPKIIAAFSRRQHKNMSLCYGDTTGALENRRDFLESTGIDYRSLVCAQQTHSGNVRYVTEKDRGSGALSYETSIADTDALITDKRDLALAIFTADCLSVFLYDPKQPAVGLVHAGWKGTSKNISGHTIEAMRRNFNSNPQDLFAGFGPVISKCCYSVEEEFKNFFTYGLSEKEGGLYLDLAAVNKKQLLDSGLKEANIFDTVICTVSQIADYFSFRQEGAKSGRMISVIMLK